MITYIKLLQIIEDFADEHIQVQRFDSDFQSEMNQFQTSEESFTTLYVSPITNINRFNDFYDGKDFIIRVHCLDVIEKSRRNISTVLNNTDLILSDLYIYLKGAETNDFEITSDSIVLPLNNYTLDYLTGWYMDISISVDNTSFCDVPFYNEPVLPIDCDDIIIPPVDCLPSILDVNGDTFTSIPSGDTFNLPVKDTEGTLVGSKVGSEWIVPSASVITTAKLMKTNDTVSYRDGDDGDLEKGRATDFFTLSDNNPFGNTNKLTDELGTQIYANNIVLDWSTYDGSEVLGYDRRVNAGNANVNVSHDQAVDASLAHSNSGFTSGWRLTNRNEFNNIINDGASIWVNYSPFDLNATNLGYIVSTVRTNGVSYFYFPNSGTIVPLARSFVGGGVRYIACRDFTNVELGI